MYQKSSSSFLGLLSQSFAKKCRKTTELHSSFFYNFGTEAKPTQGLFKRNILSIPTLCQEAFDANKQLNPKSISKLVTAIPSSPIQGADLDAITKLCVDLNATKKLDDSNASRNLINATSEKLFKIPQGKLLADHEMRNAVSHYIFVAATSGNRTERLLHKILNESSAEDLALKDLKTLSHFVFSLTKVYEKVSSKFVQALYNQNKHLIEEYLSKDSRLTQAEIDLVITTLHTFHRLHIDLNSMSKALELFFKNGSFIQEASTYKLVPLLRLVGKNEQYYSMYSEILKNELMNKFTHLNMTSLSQFLYSYYQVSSQMEIISIQISEISQLLSHFRDQLGRLKQIKKEENKAISTILLFIREFVYNDVDLLKDLITTVSTHSQDCELMTVALLCHTIPTVRAEALYQELPSLYKLVLMKTKHIKNWDSNELENLKSVWGAMAMSQIYDFELLDRIREIFMENTSKISRLTLKTHLIHLSDILMNDKLSDLQKAKFVELKGEIEKLFSSMSDKIPTRIITESFFQEEVAQELQKLGIQFEKEKEIEHFTVDFRLGKNKAIECVGPAHFTTFSKKLKGQATLRARLLKNLGYNVLFLSSTDWENHKQQKTTDQLLRDFANKKE